MHVYAKYAQITPKVSDEKIIAVDGIKDRNIKPGDIIEVQGIATSNTSMNSKFVIVYPDSPTKFDFGQYNVAVEFLHLTNHYDVGTAGWLTDVKQK